MRTVTCISFKQKIAVKEPEKSAASKIQRTSDRIRIAFYLASTKKTGGKSFLLQSVVLTVFYLNVPTDGSRIDDFLDLAQITTKPPAAVGTGRGGEKVEERPTTEGFSS